MADVVCCIDVGTTQTKVALIDDQGRFVWQCAAPAPGAAAGDANRALDQDALETTVCGLIRGLVAEASRDHVEAICLTNQRATLLALDDAGRALTMLSWKDPRANEALADLVVAGGGVNAPGMLRRLPDATQVTLVAHPESEAALLGTASIAWYGLGVFDDLKAAARAMAGSPGRRQEPNLSSEQVANRYARYCRWVETLLAVAEAT